MLSSRYSYAVNPLLFNEVRDDANSLCEQLDEFLNKVDEKFNDDFILYVVSDGKDSLYRGIAIGDFDTNLKVFGIQLDIIDDEIIISPNSTIINDKRLKRYLNHWLRKKNLYLVSVQEYM